MILEEVRRRIVGGTRGGLLAPRYRDYCLANVPAAVQSLLGAGGPKRRPLSGILDRLGADRPKKVILFLLDGFGFNLWLRQSRTEPMLRRIARGGVLCPLTSVFPSSTAPALTTLHTGLTPRQHGIPEWWTYLREIDRIVKPIPFTPLGETGLDLLLEQGVDPSLLTSAQTLYQRLARRKVPSFAFLRDRFVRGAYTRQVYAGSAAIPYRNLSDLFDRLRQAVETGPAPSYLFAYWDGIDAAAHAEGPDGDACRAAISRFCDGLEREFLARIDRKAARDVILLVTADHGHIQVEPGKMIMLDRVRGLPDRFAVSPAGRAITPWGSPRAVFLSIKPKELDAAAALLRRSLGDKALVRKTAPATRQGLFGPGKNHPEWKHRAGNLLIIPRARHTVWYPYEDGGVTALRGLHGGLTPDEMLIPFAAMNLETLL